MILQMSARPERQIELRGIEAFATSPTVAFSTFVDRHGNFCRRLSAPPGYFRLQQNAIISDSGLPEPEFPEAQEMPIEALPDDVLYFLMASRYVDTDLLGQTAWDLFGQIQPGWTRVEAIMGWVNRHIAFNYMDADATRTAFEAFGQGKGVCRDYAHLAIAFCRALNIPARYVNSYLGDIGVPAVPDPMDFAASVQVYLSGRWWNFDPRNNARRIGRIPVGYGRDAADVALISSFGQHRLVNFTVIAEECDESGAVLDPCPHAM
ncbi:MAG: transglutaminase-like domain-containing protein [Paracoccus sp. (in: a-proteobacteria)]